MWFLQFRKQVKRIQSRIRTFWKVGSASRFKKRSGPPTLRQPTTKRDKQVHKGIVEQIERQEDKQKEKYKKKNSTIFKQTEQNRKTGQ